MWHVPEKIECMIRPKKPWNKLENRMKSVVRIHRNCLVTYTSVPAARLLVGVVGEGEVVGRERAEAEQKTNRNRFLIFKVQVISAKIRSQRRVRKDHWKDQLLRSHHRTPSNLSVIVNNIIQHCWSCSIQFQDLHAQDMKMTEQMKTDLEELHHIAEKEPDFYVPNDRKLGSQITSQIYTPPSCPLPRSWTLSVEGEERPTIGVVLKPQTGFEMQR